MANGSMFVTCNRVLVIEAVEKDGKIVRLRIKNGDTFFTAFLSKKMPPLPASIKEGSQVTLGGFIKATLSEKYGMQYAMTATSVVELDHTSGRAKSATTEADPENDQQVETPKGAKK